MKGERRQNKELNKKESRTVNKEKKNESERKKIKEMK